jgi:hypothetical protein
VFTLTFSITQLLEQKTFMALEEIVSTQTKASVPFCRCGASSTVVIFHMADPSAGEHDCQA